MRISQIFNASLAHRGEPSIQVKIKVGLTFIVVALARPSIHPRDEDDLRLVLLMASVRAGVVTDSVRPYSPQSMHPYLPNSTQLNVLTLKHSTITNPNKDLYFSLVLIITILSILLGKISPNNDTDVLSFHSCLRTIGAHNQQKRPQGRQQNNQAFTS